MTCASLPVHSKQTGTREEEDEGLICDTRDHPPPSRIPSDSLCRLEDDPRLLPSCSLLALPALPLLLPDRLWADGTLSAASNTLISRGQVPLMSLAPAFYRIHKEKHSNNQHGATQTHILSLHTHPLTLSLPHTDTC